MIIITKQIKYNKNKLFFVVMFSVCIICVTFLFVVFCFLLLSFLFVSFVLYFLFVFCFLLLLVFLFVQREYTFQTLKSCVYTFQYFHEILNPIVTEVWRRPSVLQRRYRKGGSQWDIIVIEISLIDVSNSRIF